MRSRVGTRCRGTVHRSIVHMSLAFGFASLKCVFQLSFFHTEVVLPSGSRPWNV